MKETQPDQQNSLLRDFLSIRPPEPAQVLKVLPPKKYHWDEASREAKIKSDIASTYKDQQKALLDSCGKPNYTLDDYELKCLLDTVTKEIRYADFVSRMHLVLWLESERILSLLRTKGIHTDPSAETRDKAIGAFAIQLELCTFAEANCDSLAYMGPGPERDRENYSQPDVIAPNAYFEATQVNLVVDYGYAFYGIVPKHVEQVFHPPTGRRGPRPPPDPPPAEKLAGINTDFFAAYLGGDKRLGHDVIYFVPEQRFYFFDYLANSYLPTTEEKIRLWLSLTIQARAFGQKPEVANMILTQFRSKEVFDEIVTKAKSMLAADASFFGLAGKLRWEDKQEQERKTRVRYFVDAFVKCHVRAAESEVLPVTECLNLLERFFKLNEVPLPAPKESKNYIEEALLRIHGKTVRNDLRSATGLLSRSWKGLQLYASGAEFSGVEKQDAPASVSDLSVASVPPALDTVTQVEPAETPDASTIAAPLAPSLGPDQAANRAPPTTQAQELVLPH